MRETYPEVDEPFSQKPSRPLTYHLRRWLGIARARLAQIKAYRAVRCPRCGGLWNGVRAACTTCTDGATAHDRH